MRFMARKSGQEEPTSFSEEEARVQSLRAALGPELNEEGTQYTTDACLRRYLRARNWNAKRAEKMMRESLAWRATYKPEKIRWEDVAKEAETGKVFRGGAEDKQGRAVLVMRPAKQNTTAREGQIKQLVYSMENAILNLPAGQEEMVWLVDFKGWSMNMPALSVKLAQEAAHILQRHYPERLGVGVLINPPHIFEAFWRIVKPFLDTRTARKVKFVYSNDAASLKLLSELFDSKQLEEYSTLMRQDDAKFGLERKIANVSSTQGDRLSRSRTAETGSSVYLGLVGEQRPFFFGF